MAIHQDEAESQSASAQVLHLPVKQKVPSEGSNSSHQVAAAQQDGDLAREYERFQLQVQLDIECERELLYKSLFVVELIAFLFVLREILIRWLA
jgi:hypothetical protein